MRVLVLIGTFLQSVRWRVAVMPAPSPIVRVESFACEGLELFEPAFVCCPDPVALMGHFESLSGAALTNTDPSRAVPDRTAPWTWRSASTNMTV